MHFAKVVNRALYRSLFVILGTMLVGQVDKADIKLKGALVEEEHCKISCSPEHVVTIQNISECTTYVNGQLDL